MSVGLTLAVALIISIVLYCMGTAALLNTTGACNGGFVFLLFGFFLLIYVMLAIASSTIIIHDFDNGKLTYLSLTFSIVSLVALIIPILFVLSESILHILFFLPSFCFSIFTFQLAKNIRSKKTIQQN
jgi:hypothetical protein